MKKLKMESMDLIARNIKKLKELFPSCITESKGEDGRLKQTVRFDVLQALLGKELADGPEAYEFNWVGKRAAMAEAARPIHKTLRPVISPTESKNWNTTENLYIEGDNLDVLKLLQESYLGKVKMIYIDPPYNTGHDFIYKDSFRMDEDAYAAQTDLFDEEGNRQFAENNDSNPRFHSDWCSMMYSRLLLARNLLTDDGLLFISIDDNEQASLKKICDELFGETNFKSNSVIINNRGGRDYGGIAKQHDYLLIYSKSPLAKINLINEFNKEFQYHDNIGGFNLMELRNRNVKFNNQNRPNLYYPFYIDPSSSDKNGLFRLSLEYQPGFIEVFPAKSNGIQTVWRWGKEEKARPNLNIEIFGKKNKNGGFMIVQKYRKTCKMQRSVWDEKDFINEKGTDSIKELFGKNCFDYPKSPFIIKRILELGTKKDSIILDFFSGSATTAHAVMQLNAEDGGHRKFIMVQLPEACDPKSEAYKAGYKTICDIGKERIRRAGEKIQKEHPDVQLDTGFRVFRVDDSPMEDVYYSAGTYTQDTLTGMISNVKPDRTALDLFFSCILDWGLPLDLPYAIEEICGYAVHNYNDGMMLACFADAISEELIVAMARKQPVRVVFRDSSFPDSPAKINAEEIFKRYSPNTLIKVI